MPKPKKIEYTLIERYNNQFNNLNKKVYLISVDSQNLEEAHLLEITEIENLYKYLSSNNAFNLVNNNDLEMKSWLNVSIFDIDVIQKYFLDNLDTPKKVRIENINKLKEIYPNSVYIIKN